MKRFIHWTATLWLVARFLAYRAGLVRPPAFTGQHVHLIRVLRDLLGWTGRLRISGAENVPAQGPAIFVGNHARADDPLVMFEGIYMATNDGHTIQYLMRNDFFEGYPFEKFVGYNDFMIRMGGFLIDRGNVTLGQLKPMVKTLQEGKSFGMFPGATRSRSGVFFEYRDNITEPGGVSFFVAHAQRGKPGLRVPVIPMVRTWNPVNGQSPVVYGTPQYLPENADRVAQRAFDFQIAETMATYTEVNAAQALANVLFLRCVHARTEDRPVDDYVEDVRMIFTAIPKRTIDPAAKVDPKPDVLEALSFFEAQGLLRVHAGQVTLGVESILEIPELKDYVKKNAIRYLVNQTLHLPDLGRAAERAVLGV